MANTSQKASSMASDLSEAAQDELAMLRDKVETLMSERVTPMMSDMADRAEYMARDTADRVSEQMDRLSDGVREKPLMAVGIAAAVGFFAAILLRR